MDAMAPRVPLSSSAPALPTYSPTNSSSTGGVARAPQLPPGLGRGGLQPLAGPPKLAMIPSSDPGRLQLPGGMLAPLQSTNSLSASLPGVALQPPKSRPDPSPPRSASTPTARPAAATSLGDSIARRAFAKIAASIVGCPAELLKTSRELVKQQDVVIVGNKGVFSVRCIVLADSILLVANHATKGLVFLGLIEFSQALVNTTSQVTVLKRMKSGEHAPAIGKYKLWIQLRHHIGSEPFITCSTDKETELLCKDLGDLISTCRSSSFRTLQLSPKPAPRQSHRFIFLGCLPNRFH